jgi:hypothetical protein
VGDARELVRWLVDHGQTRPSVRLYGVGQPSRVNSLTIEFYLSGCRVISPSGAAVTTYIRKVILLGARG